MKAMQMFTASKNSRLDSLVDETVDRFSVDIKVNFLDNICDDR